MPTKPLASQPCTCKDSFTLNTIDNEVKELLESCLKLRIKPNFPLKPAYETGLHIKVQNILKASLDSIPSPSPSVKIQIVDRKVCLRWKDKILVRFSINFWKQNFCWHHPAMFFIITSRLSSYIFSTLISLLFCTLCIVLRRYFG